MTPAFKRDVVPTAIFGAALVALGMDYGVTQFHTAVGAYTPQHYGWVTFVGFAYLFGTWLYARELGRTPRIVGLIAELTVLVVCISGFVVYHLDHEAPYVLVRDHMEHATPYHVQIALPMFITAVGGVLVLVATMQVDRRAPALTSRTAVAA